MCLSELWENCELMPEPVSCHRREWMNTHIHNKADLKREREGRQEEKKLWQKRWLFKWWHPFYHREIASDQSLCKKKVWCGKLALHLSSSCRSKQFLCRVQGLQWLFVLLGLFRWFGNAVILFTFLLRRWKALSYLSLKLLLPFTVS